MTRTPQNLSTPPEISIFGDRPANPPAQHAAPPSTTVAASA
jgi:hypothetical protein